MGDHRVLSDADIALSLRDFYVDMPGERVKGVNLDIRNGEIFGIGGLAGQRKTRNPQRHHGHIRFRRHCGTVLARNWI